jgi:hypothetical protein
MNEPHRASIHSPESSDRPSGRPLHRSPQENRRIYSFFTPLRPSSRVTWFASRLQPAATPSPDISIRGHALITKRCSRPPAASQNLSGTSSCVPGLPVRATDFWRRRGRRPSDFCSPHRSRVKTATKDKGSRKRCLTRHVYLAILLLGDLLVGHLRIRPHLHPREETDPLELVLELQQPDAT